MQSQAIDVETFGVSKSSLSFEEFKKSLVRIASICAVSTRLYNSDMQPINEEDGLVREENEWNNASDASGGYVMGHGPKKEVIKLIKKNPAKGKKSKK